MRTLREFRERLRTAKADRRLRHGPSRFGIALFDSIHYAPADAWESIVPAERLFLRPVYLAALEASRPADLRFRYAMLYDGTRPVAVAAVQVLEFSFEALGSRREAASSPPKKLEEKIRRALRKVTDHLSLRVLLCGNAFVSGEHGFCHVPELDPVDAIHGLADALYRIRRADKLHGQIAAALVKDFYAESVPAAGELERFGYRGFEVDPNMVVSIRPEWQSADDYTAAMTGKYRRRVRDARRKGQKLVKRALDGTAIRAEHGRIRELFDAVHLKSKFRLASLPPDYFPALASALGDAFRLTAYYLRDDMVGFASSVRWGERIEGHYLGLDYAHNVEHAIYQNILYDHVAEAIERRCAELYLGRTALEIKSTIGAEGRPIRCYMRHRNPASNTVVRPLFHFAKPTSWTPRNPFPR